VVNPLTPHLFFTTLSPSHLLEGGRSSDDEEEDDSAVAKVSAMATLSRWSTRVRK